MEVELGEMKHDEVERITEMLNEKNIDWKKQTDRLSKRDTRRKK